MTHARAPVSAPLPGAPRGVSGPAPAWAHALLWAGAAACVAGIALSGLFGQWRPGRFAELLLLALLAAALAWPLRRALRWSWAGALACVQLAALVMFAGPLPVAATVLFALAAVAVGGAVAGRAPLALQCACGLAALAGVLGWLLPLPIHARWSYLVLCVGVIAWRHRALRDALRSARHGWSRSVAAHPAAAAWAVLALGLAATACWLPTLQVDDLGYHLRLPWELQLRGRYAPDPWRHAWAVAPWASDVQHAVVQVLAGGEARGALNALWIALAASAVWHLATAMGGTPRAAWAAVALYASLPMTAALAAGMQTETATTALLAWLAWRVLARDGRDGRDGREGARPLATAALLAGGLAGLKLMAGAQALLLVAWAGWRERRHIAWRWLAPCIALALLVAGSSYVYGAVLAGNPFLPLFNATFGSPYFAAVDFQDLRWQAGWTPWLPWSLTFDTARYHEGFAGAAGVAMVLLSGAWFVALVDRRTRGLALACTAMLALTLAPLQYLRYAVPALVLLLPCLAVVADGIGRRGGMRLLAVACVLGLAFQANAHWMLRTGALKQAVLALGDDRPLFAGYAPERTLLATLRNQPRGDVLDFDGNRPWVAELGQRGRMLAWYDPRLQAAAAVADADPSGAHWARILRAHRISDVIVHEPSLHPSRRNALRLLGAREHARAGTVAWWRLPAAGRG